MLFAWAVQETLKRRGHRVSILAYDLSRRVAFDVDFHEQSLSEQGVRVYRSEPHRAWVQSRLGPNWMKRVLVLANAFSPRILDLFPAVGFLRRDLQRVVEQDRPDVCWTYSLTPTLAAASLVPRIPIVASSVDLEWRGRALSLRKRTTLRDWLIGLSTQHGARLLRKHEAGLLSKADAVFVHAAQSAQWLRAQGLERCEYLPVPVLGANYNRWAAEHQPGRGGPDRRPRTLGVVGRLTGLQTQHGLRMFIEHTVPILRKQFDEADVEIHIIGPGQLPESLKLLCRRYSITVRGYVPDIGAEFSSMDAMIVPVNIDLGFRVRIAEAFSYGTPVIAHRAACAGMPEVLHGENALLAEDESHLAEVIGGFLRDRGELAQRLSRAARSTFESHYRAEIVGGAMVETMERLAGFAPSQQAPEPAAQNQSLHLHESAG